MQVAGLSTEHFVAEAAHHLPAAQASELGIACSYYVRAAAPPTPPPAVERAEALPDGLRIEATAHTPQPITLQSVKGLVTHPLQNHQPSPVLTAPARASNALLTPTEPPTPTAPPTLTHPPTASPRP